MLKLMKYEIIKKARLLTYAFITFSLMELGIIAGLYFGRNGIPVAIILMFLMIFGIFGFALFDAIRSYSYDINRKHGYMLFMTPNNGSTIIGSKLLISLFEFIIILAIASLFMYINFRMGKSLYLDFASPEVKEGVFTLKQTFQGLIPNVWQMMILIIEQIIEWLGLFIMIYFAITIRKTILANSKHGWLLSFILFIGVYTVISTINFLSMFAFGYWKDIMAFETMIEQSGSVNAGAIAPIIYKYSTLASLIYIAFSSVLFVLTSKLLNKRVDL